MSTAAARVAGATKVYGEGEAAVTALDDLTLRLDLRDPLPFILDILKFYTAMPVPRHVIERLISEGKDLIHAAWWMMAFPGLFLTMTLVSFALIADGIRDAFDVKPMPWKRR